VELSDGVKWETVARWDYRAGPHEAVDDVLRTRVFHISICAIALTPPGH
jgi:hypothetical protein